MQSLEDLMCLPHKPGVDPLDWRVVNPKLLVLAQAYVDYCQRHKIPILFTSIIRAGIPGVSVSSTHEEGRAFDASARGWTAELIDDFLAETRRLAPIGAISKSDGLARPFVFHEGTAYHLHAQVRA